MTLAIKDHANNQIEKSKALYPEGKELEQLVQTTKVLSTCPYYQKLGPGGVLAIWLTAREMNLPPMMCLNGGMYTFSGQVTLSSQLIHQMIINAGHRADILRLDETQCTLRFIRGDRAKGSNSFEWSYSVKDAEKAGLLNKKNWQTNLKDMLFNRCLSAGGRKFMPDALMGAYAIGEMPDDGNILDTMPQNLSVVECENSKIDSDILETNFNETVSDAQAVEIKSLIDNCNEETKKKINNYIENELKTTVDMLPMKQFELIRKRALKDQKLQEEQKTLTELYYEKSRINTTV
jgi:hypothetical protein